MSTDTSEKGLEIRLLNLRPESVDVPKLRIVCEKIVELATGDKIVPVRVMIFAEHPIVSEALADKTIQIIASIKDAPTTILVPLSHKGNRIIVKTMFQGRESYGLYSLPENSGVDLAGCLKHE